MSNPDTTPCDEALATLALSRDGGRAATRDAAAALAHVEGCVACRSQLPRARAVAGALAGYQVSAPAPDAVAVTLAAAAPVLARRAAEARSLRRRVAWAFTLALLPLPLLVYANVQALIGIHDLLLRVLPPALSLYVTGCLAAGLTLLLALSYASVPLLAARRPWLFALEDRDVHVPA